MNSLKGYHEDELDEDKDEEVMEQMETEEVLNRSRKKTLTDYQKRIIKSSKLTKNRDEFDPNLSPDAKCHELQKPVNRSKEMLIKEGESMFCTPLSKLQQVKRKFEPTNDPDEPTPKKISYSESATPAASRWDQTPAYYNGGETPGPVSEDVTPARASRWDMTPKATPMDTPMAHSLKEAPTPGASQRKSRWDETTPNLYNGMNTPGVMTPNIGGATPIMSTPIGLSAMNIATPAHGLGKIEQGYFQSTFITNEELDALFPPEYEILPAPANYAPSDTHIRKLVDMPTPSPQIGFSMQTPGRKMQICDNQPSNPDLPPLNKEDSEVLTMLCHDFKQDEMTVEDQKRLTAQELLHKIKNGTPAMRKNSMRQIASKTMEIGPEVLLSTNLALLGNPRLEPEERYYLTKVLERIVFVLDELVRPFVRDIYRTIAIELIDEDYMARCRSKEVLSSVAKAAGFAPMIAILKPDLVDQDEAVRNIASRTLALITFTFGMNKIIPFLKAICLSNQGLEIRQSGFRAIKHFAINGRCSVLPHLTELVKLVRGGFDHVNLQVSAAEAIAALAEASTPYGIESFEVVMDPIMKAIRRIRDKTLAPYLKAMGCIIPLMDGNENEIYCIQVTTGVVIQHFSSSDPNMRKVVLRTLKLICGTSFIEASFIKSKVLNEFFRCFWDNRSALKDGTKNFLIDITAEICNKVGTSDVIEKLAYFLKDDSEIMRRITIETIERVIVSMGSTDIDDNLLKNLMDGILYTYQNIVSHDKVRKVINSIAFIISSFGKRMKGYIPQFVGIIQSNVGHANAKIRENSCDLMTRISHVMAECGEEENLLKLSHIMFENLGEESPEVLGSIIGALTSVFNVVGATKMSPPTRDILPKLSPILKNRNEKVQQNCIDLVGRIADRGAEQVSNKEWMRICFELLELIKAHRKIIRRAAVNTFGYIAKAIGPQDVLATLLNNLKVQERQNRVCTTIAIAIVAEVCSPYTVLPALMNEYRVPELNVQNGVLKSFSFMFEYIGPVSKDYIYTVTPLLEDAMMERDLVHRQTAMSAIGHLGIGLRGFGREDAFNHLMNFVWPNILEMSLHAYLAFAKAIQGMIISLGPTKVIQYIVAGLFHPARKVRDHYWKMYNSVYEASQDALVASYPKINSDERNNYGTCYLDCLL